jgi:O-antigen ligase
MLSRSKTFQSIRQAPSQLPRASLSIIALVCLLSLMVLGPYMTYKPQPFTGEGSPLRQLGYLMVVAMAVAGLRGKRLGPELLVIPLSMVVALLWCWLSLFWAIDPDKAFRRLALTTLIIWIIYLVVRQVRFETTIDVMRLFLLVVLFANYAIVFALPTEGIHQVDSEGDPGLIGSWRGILLQKNFAGAVCSFTIMLFLFDAKHIPPLLRWGSIILSFVFLYKTNSKTSIMLLIMACSGGYAYAKLNPNVRKLVFCILMLVFTAVGFGVYVFWDLVAAPFQSEDSLTGRVQIWPILVAYWKENWLLGAGYGSFWNIGPDGPIFLYARNWVTLLGNGHNGYLDLLVQIGLPGLVLVIFATMIVPLGRLFWQPMIVGEKGGMLVAFILFCAGHNVTETSLFERDTIVQTFLMFACALAAQLSQVKPQRPQKDRRLRR